MFNNPKKNKTKQKTYHPVMNFLEAQLRITFENACRNEVNFTIVLEENQEKKKKKK